MCCSTFACRRGVAMTLERRHELGRIAILKFAPVHRLARCHQAAETLIGLRPVGHERELVHRMEPHDIPHRPAGGEQMRETSIRKHALDEVLAQARIVEPPFLFDRQRGKRVTRASANSPRPDFSGIPPVPYTLTRSRPQVGESFFNTKPQSSALGQFLEPAARVAAHAGRLILCRLVGEQANLGPCLHQPERFARGRHAGLDFRAHRHPLDEGSQRLDQERIPFVAAVEAHAFSEQAGRNAEADGFAVHRGPVRRLP